MMWKKGFTPSPINQINFGKYKGKTFEDVFAIDPDYIRWMRDTTDPADVKNQGKYAKQNQERIKYLDNLLTEGVPSVPSDVVAPKIPAPAGNIPVNAKTFEQILQILLKIEEKLDMVLGKQIVTKIEMEPDSDTPF